MRMRASCNGLQSRGEVSKRCKSVMKRRESTKGVAWGTVGTCPEGCKKIRGSVRWRREECQQLGPTGQANDHSKRWALMRCDEPMRRVITIADDAR
jgi:hypothetical protein